MTFRIECGNNSIACAPPFWSRLFGHAFLVTPFWSGLFGQAFLVRPFWSGLFGQAVETKEQLLFFDRGGTLLRTLKEAELV
jgi:hypothetical protein